MVTIFDKEDMDVDCIEDVTEPTAKKQTVRKALVVVYR